MCLCATEQIHKETFKILLEAGLFHFFRGSKQADRSLQNWLHGTESRGTLCES